MISLFSHIAKRSDVQEPCHSYSAQRIAELVLDERGYIDPGTGSMLFTVLVGLISAGVYALRGAFIKLRFALSGGREAKDDADRIAYAIFTDSKRYWNVFEPICDEFEKRGIAAHYLSASPDDPAFDKPYKVVTCEFVGEGNKAFARMNMLKADVVLSSTPGLDVYQWKRSRDVKWYTHILHAVSDATMYRMFGLDYYDAVMLTGEYQAYQVRELERLRKLPAKDLPIVGQPYMDVLAKRLDSETNETGLSSERKTADDEQAQSTPRDITVLLAPSWGDSAILNVYGGKVIDALLDAGFSVIVRPHPQSFASERELIDDLMATYPQSDQLEWSVDNDNFEVLRRSDIMVSDFSGVIFDFALVFDKPVIYTKPSYDKSPYDACWVEEELWTFQTLPLIGKQLTDEALNHMGAFIESCFSDASLQEGRDQARNECWMHRGASAKLVVDYLVDKRAQICAPEEDA